MNSSVGGKLTLVVLVAALVIFLVRTTKNRLSGFLE